MATHTADRRALAATAIGAALLPFTVMQLAFAPAGWIAPVLFLYGLRASRRRLLLGVPPLALMVAYAVNLLSAFPFGLLFVVGVVCLGFAFSVPYLLDRWLADRLPRVLQSALFPATMVAVDWLLSLSDIFATNFSPAYAQHSFRPVMQIASVTGIWGITFLQAWFAAAATRGRRKDFAAFAGVLILVIGYGAVRLQSTEPPAKTVTIALLGTESESTSVERVLARSREAAQAGAQLLVWPELAISVAEADRSTLTRQVAALAMSENVALTFGLGVRLDRASFPFRENRSVLIAPDGDLLWDYEKTQTVPGLEAAYVAKGPGRLPIVAFDGLRLSTAICRDLFYPNLLRQAAIKGADLVVAPTWSFASGGPSVDFVVFSVRAIETGATLVLADHRGAQVLDPEGRVIAQKQFAGPDDSMRQEISIRSRPTLYGKLGDVFAWLCVALGLICVAVALLKSRRADARREGDGRDLTIPNAS